MTSESALLHTVLKPGRALVAMAHMDAQANESQGIVGNTLKGPPFSFIIFMEASHVARPRSEKCASWFCPWFDLIGKRNYKAIWQMAQIQEWSKMLDFSATTTLLRWFLVDWASSISFWLTHSYFYEWWIASDSNVVSRVSNEILLLSISYAWSSLLMWG